MLKLKNFAPTSSQAFFISALCSFNCSRYLSLEYGVINVGGERSSIYDFVKGKNKVGKMNMCCGVAKDCSMDITKLKSKMRAI